MENLIIFLILFILVYIFYLLFVLRKPRALNKMKAGKEFTLLKSIYKLDYDKIDVKRLANEIALTNAFILSFMTTLVCTLNNWISNFYIWLLVSMVMALVLMIPLTLIIYHIIGTKYKNMLK